MVRSALCLWLWWLIAAGAAAAQPHVGGDLRDPFDSQDFSGLQTSPPGAPDPDRGKTAEELIAEAVALRQAERPLDARTKLLKALAKDPLAFQAHLLLADYYLREVGHFRLAFKYAARCRELFESKFGQPPYADPYAQLVHRDLLNLLSSIRLNLDDYRGALAIMDDFQRCGYYDSWVAPHRAWILMKLGRLPEAIRTARMGLLAGAETGQTLNILGILLSMTDQKPAALDILRQAARYERSMGKSGRPATPLNNAGEVYREMFREGEAEESWREAVRLPDGCEHVLPSLNLALLRLDRNDPAAAARALDDFEKCAAQFPLRNGEEHRALVHLARGRVLMLAGRPAEAIEHFEAARERRQWFGKIGASGDDLRVAAMISLAQALRRQDHRMASHRPDSWREGLSAAAARLFNRLRAAWLLRRARQILAADLKQIEDLHLRHTDSLLDYSSLGEVLAGFPARVLERRIAAEMEEDRRAAARPYYHLYLAENALAGGDRGRAWQLIGECLKHARADEDQALRVRAMLLKLGMMEPGSGAYRAQAYEIFRAARPELRSFGFRLPVNFSEMDQEARRELSRSAFLPTNAERLPCAAAHRLEEGQHRLSLTCQAAGLGSVTVKAADLRSAVNSLADAVFSREL